MRGGGEEVRGGERRREEARGAVDGALHVLARRGCERDAEALEDHVKGDDEREHCGVRAEGGLGRRDEPGEDCQRLDLPRAGARNVELVRAEGCGCRMWQAWREE